ncbi:hypothetical protein MUK42_10962 [Musa troglodytarum]|nr:hypothetical protein MUK42_10962 [Musa troglodytarum]
MLLLGDGDSSLWAISWLCGDGRAQAESALRQGQGTLRLGDGGSGDGSSRVQTEEERSVKGGEATRRHPWFYSPLLLRT